MYSRIRETLEDFYFTSLPVSAEEIRAEVYSKMDEYDAAHPAATACELKARQYEYIAEAMRPVVFEELPFFFETGALVAFSDGRFDRGAEHASGWLYHKKQHLFRDADPFALDIYGRQQGQRLYTQCGIYADKMHMGIPMKKVFRVGLGGILEEVKAALEKCADGEEREFLAGAHAGIRALIRAAERFREAAERAGMGELAAIASRVPLHPPETFHEGLCVLAFMRKVFGALEGMGFNSMGRVDVLLGPLYDADSRRGADRAVQKDLVTCFLLIWDCTLDRRRKMENAFDYEMENTITLGGCDENGAPVYNEVTRLFLEARDEEEILYPKFMLRFGKNSPEEYLREVSAPLLKGKSYSLFENDDSVIPAMKASGIDERDAREYAVGGCWDILTPDQSIHNSGEYFNILRPLEMSVHREETEMRECGLWFEPLEECETFDEVYARYIAYLRRVLVQKAAFTAAGARIRPRVYPVPLFSALTETCIPAGRDLTNGGGKYNIETEYLCCFAEAVDSLLAIRYLCYENHYCTVAELFDQCRRDWPNEILRQRALNAPSYGDGSESSSRFTGRLVHDIWRITRDLPTSFGGQYRLGSNLYTEVLWWGRLTKALPNGRRSGDYLSQGITPSRQNPSVSLMDVYDSLRYTDMNEFAAAASITITLPAGKMDMEKMVLFFRSTANTGLQAVQPNCVSREELLAAREHPEDYGHIIVRVCGFSAPFVLLVPHYQDEVLSRVTMEV